MRGLSAPAWRARRPGRPNWARSRRAGADQGCRASAFSTWVLERFPGYGRACLVAALVLTPLAVHRGVPELFSTGKVAVLWVTSLAAVAFWIGWSAERRAWLPSNRAAYAAAAVVAASALATVFSLSPPLSLLGISTRYSGLIPTVLFAATMVAVVGLFWERPAGLRSVVWAVAAASVVVAISVLLQQAGVDRVLWAGPVPGTRFDYPFGTVGHSNFAGAHLGLAPPCLGYLIATTRRRWARSALGVALAVDLLALWYTHSRGGMLAALVGAGAMWLTGKDRLGRGAKFVLGLGAAAAIAVAVAVVWHPGTEAPAARLAGSDTLRTKTLLYRLDYWRAATSIFLDNPVVGTGPDTYYATYPRHRPDQAGPGIVPSEDFQTHNIFLERAAETGALGAGSYLVLVGLALSYGYGGRRRVTGEARRLLACFVGLLAAYLTQGLFSMDLPDLALIGWVALGSIFAIADRAALAARPSNSPALPASAVTGSPAAGHVRRRPRWPVHVALAAGLVSLVVVGLRPLEAGVKAKSGQLHQAARLNPLHAGYRTQLANQAALAGGAPDPADKERLFRSAQDQYLDALRLQPADIGIMVSLANVHTSWAELDPGHFHQAEVWWQQAIHHDPTNQSLRHSYETELPAAKRHTVQRLETDTRVNPGDTASWVNLAKAHLAVNQPAQAEAALAEALRRDPANQAATRLLAALVP